MITFDKDDMRHGNHITTIFTGAMIKGRKYSQQINYFNVLPTVEDMCNLPRAGNAASAKAITGCGFIHAFTREFGLPPREWRKKKKESDNDDLSEEY